MFEISSRPLKSDLTHNGIIGLDALLSLKFVGC